MRVNLLTH